MEAADLGSTLGLALSSLRDRRLSQREWQDLLSREFLLLRAWTLGRLMIEPTSESTRVVPKAVYSFLPDHALVAHLLRRAVPFAALGLPTVCAARSKSRRALTRAVSAIADVLSIGSYLRVCTESCRDVVRTKGNKSSLLVLTGRSTTMPVVARAWGGTFLGASGRCAVTFGGDRTELYQICRSRRIPHSCSNVRASFSLPGVLRSTSRVNPASGSGSYEVREILARLHPSVVMLHDDRPGRRRLPHFVAGYSVVKCNARGQTFPSAGFGADPEHGWPGDYLV